MIDDVNEVSWSTQEKDLPTLAQHTSFYIISVDLQMTSLRT